MPDAKTAVELHFEYTLLRDKRSRLESSGPHTFKDRHPSGRVVEVVVSYADDSLMAVMRDVTLPSSAVAELATLSHSEGEALSALTREAIAVPKNEIRTTIRNLLALLKYHLRHFELGESGFSIRSEKWRIDGGALRDIPFTTSCSLNNFSAQPLDERAREGVQAALDSGVTPLIAMRHLHRAKHESQPHHKWIDATIAAELAVKEVLCRAHPAMELMLIEMPSPPFSKMYGCLLKHYLGEESPFRKPLILGQERRNVLVHKPGAAVIGSQEANDYVDVVEGAIFHLLSRLYPNDDLIRRARFRTGT